MIAGTPRTTPCYAALTSFSAGFQLFGWEGIHYLAPSLWSCRNSLWFWWCHSNSQNSEMVFEARYPSSSWWCRHPSKSPPCSRVGSLKLSRPWFPRKWIFVNSRLLSEFGASEISSILAFCKLQQYTSMEWPGQHPSAHRMGHRFQHRHILHPNSGWHWHCRTALLMNWIPLKPSWSWASSSSSTFQYHPAALAATLWSTPLVEPSSIVEQAWARWIDSKERSETLIPTSICPIASDFEAAWFLAEVVSKIIY